MSFTRESQVIVVICLVDLVVTLALLSTPHVQEGNPLMKYYLNQGVAAFVIAKLCLLFLPIFVAEWCRQYRPLFVRRCLRFTIIAYVGTYLLLFLQHNVPVIMADNLYQPPSAAVANALEHPDAYAHRP